ncbi:hypothetical protein SFRURICE_003334, partial [Spodoptera frugiperda]
VATNTPHLVSLGTGRLSTAVTLHPIKQDIIQPEDSVEHTAVCPAWVEHRRILRYVICGRRARVARRPNGIRPVRTVRRDPRAPQRAIRPPQIGPRGDAWGGGFDTLQVMFYAGFLLGRRSNYLRFNHPAEAKLMKSVLPSAHVSMAPVQFQPNDQCVTPAYVNHHNESYQTTNIQKIYKDNSLTHLDQELDMTLKEMSRKKPPVAPKKPYRDLDQSDSNSDQESRPKMTGIMAKVSKFEYYAKQQKIGRSQFYTTNENEISPKVFSSNSLTVNTPAKDVLGGKTMPNYMNKMKNVSINDNNSVDPKNCSYANVAIRNKTKIDDIVKNFNEPTKDYNKLPKKVNNDEQCDNIYGKINIDRKPDEKFNQNGLESGSNVMESSKTLMEVGKNNLETYNNSNMMEKNEIYGKIERNNVSKGISLPSPAFDRNPQYSPVYANTLYDRSMEAETRRLRNKKGPPQKRLLRLFVNNLKRNTSALKELKESIETSRPNDYEKIIDMTNAVNEKLDVVHKIRNDIKIYKTINTILTNHYIKVTRDHENCIGNKILKLEEKIKRSYDDLKLELAKMASVSVANQNISSPIQNSNVILVGNDLKCNQFNQLHIRNEMYNSIIRKIDKLFCGMAYQDRIKEEEQKEAETARLEEILNMCAEYERQISSGIPITPTEKRPHNKIITNGSLPRSVALNNPNFVQTSDGYYKFETSHNKNSPMSQSLPIQRNLSSYENFDTTPPTELTPEVVIPNQNNYENVGRMDEIGIPVFDDPSPRMHDLSSPIMIRKLHNQSGDRIPNLSSPIGSPYENVYYRNNVYGNLKPKSPNTQSPRTRIKTTFAHKINPPSPQYFIFPTPPPVDNSKKPNFERIEQEKQTSNEGDKPKFDGIEKQLSLEEEIPMIDDDLTNDLEFRYSKVANDDKKESTPEKSPDVVINKNQSFDDMKKELMADIPELEEFEKDLKENKRDKIIKNITEDIKKIDIEADSLDSTVLDDNVDELKTKYEKLKEERKKLVTEIHEIKCKMSEIRLQEDDILRELEMEKALIKGEYDSEIAILNIEQKKKMDLVESAKKIEEEIKQLKEKQESRQNEMRDRVEIATLKVERLEKDLKSNAATLEELQNAQDILDNETKISEDLEFQHLEEESELLSNREDIQNEIILLTKKIEAQKTRILTLKSEANNNLTSALDETKILHAEYVRLLNLVEELTGKVQALEKELKPIVAKLNDIERTQSPDSAFFTDQTRAKSGEFGYSPQSSDSDDIDLKISTFEDHTKNLKDKFNSIDQMSQSMTVDIERRVITDLVDSTERYSESPSKSSTSSKEKKGFWERNFDSLKRKSKKPKSPEKVDIMSQSLNENLFYNDNIEADVSLDKFNSLRHSKKKEKAAGPVKSNSSSKIPTFAALGKIMKKDSFGKRSRENSLKNDESDKENNSKNRYIKNTKPINADNKYVKAKSLSPDKKEDDIMEEIDTEDQITKVTFENTPPKESSIQSAKILHRKSCGDEPSVKEFQKMTDAVKIPSQDDIDRISKVTIDAPILPSDADMNTLGKRTLDSLMEVERKRLEMLEEQGCQVIENEREKISELKRRVQDETKKLWNQKYRSEQSKSLEEQYHSLPPLLPREDEDKTFDRSAMEDTSLIDDSFMANSSIFEERIDTEYLNFLSYIGNRNTKALTTEVIQQVNVQFFNFKSPIL